MREDVETEGATLSVWRAGEGPLLVLVGGSGSTVALSSPLYTPFSTTRTVLTYDHRGMGESRDDGAPYDMATCARDLDAVIRAYSDEPVDVLGISFGGMVALEWAVTFPTRLRRLGLWCTSAGGPLGSSYPLEELLGLTPAQRDATAVSLSDTRFTPDWLATHDADREFVARTSSAGRVPSEGYRRQLQARQGHDVSGRLSALTMPVFLGAGTTDGIAPPENARALHRALPTSSLHWYDGGHLFFLQDRRALPDTISFFSYDEGNRTIAS